jgi:hypothetical protein
VVIFIFGGAANAVLTTPTATTATVTAAITCFVFIVSSPCLFRRQVSGLTPET